MLICVVVLMSNDVRKLLRNEWRLVRIAGEARFVVFHDGEKVVKSYFISTAPVRGFERLVLGKNPIFVVEAIMRICGLCHAAHGIASAEAFEHALGMVPPRNGLLLREAAGLANRLQSHLLHLTLITRDLIKYEHYINLLYKVLALVEHSSAILARLAGTPTHPRNITLGGMVREPPQAAINEVKRRLAVLTTEYGKLMEVLLDEDKWCEKALILKKVVKHFKKLASHLFYGGRYNIDVTKVKVLNPWEYYAEGKDIVKDSTSRIALYGEERVEVGPRSRLETYMYFKDDTLIGAQIARLKECSLIIERLKEIIEELTPGAPVRSYEIVYRAGRGVGVYEAPRGTLIHYVELDSEGRVRNYSIVVPTMFNIPIMEEASAGIPKDVATVIPRLYDPCIPCSTHLIHINEVIKR